MREWAVIIGIASFKVINIKHIDAMNIDGVVRTNMTSQQAIEMATELNKVLDEGGFK